ncbi:T9SS type A sorting domain-containing protein [Algoriphagus sanaruensis]|uniref:Secretion system C-terminal sorting domain-containing protein n=1 Tax=Algoriphagus sanaruensis TaxID=1727163 RepID=A0A142ESJ1_9BACT|nr:T9SS type A sorting domain-containing protein [Algoriphagus sanaruensis]AMQ58096.1 hypothetical protein AO498_16730 [Algoriphagus sanaruensis]
MKHLYKIILVLVLQTGFSLGGWSQKLTLAEDAVLGIQVGGFSFVTGAVQLKGTSELIGPEAIILKNSTFIQLQGSGVKLRTREMKRDGLVEIPVGIDSKTVLSIHNKDVAASYGISMEELNEADALPFSWMIKATTSGGQAISDLSFFWHKSIEPEIFENKALVKKNQTAWEVVPDQVIGDTLVNLEGFSDYGSQETIFSVKNISSQLDAVGTVTDISCFDQADGSINLTVFGGTPPYSFKWSNRRTSEDISNLSAGTYSVKITDAVRARKTLSFTITNPPLLTLNTTQTDLNYCNPEQKGSITPSATGGTGAYSFSINTGASLTNGAFTNLEAGTYIITVTDENQCSQVKTVTIAASSEITFQTEKSDVTSCTSNGSIRITATGGRSPYSYSIDGGTTWQSANSFSNLSQGTYSLQVKDANECVTSPSAVQITDNGSDPYEDNNTLGTASAISLELPYQARLGSQGDIDWFRYVNPKGRKNTRTHYLNFAKQDGQIAELYDQAGLLVLPNAGSIPGSPAAYNLLSRRSYYIKVSGASSLSCYTVSLSTALTAFRIIENQSEEDQTSEVQTSENQDTPRKYSAEDVYDVIAYPNPSDGIFRLALPGFADGEARMRIMDWLGRMIRDELGQVENGKKLGEVDLSYVAKGVYYVQVIQDRKVKTVRVIIQ